MSATTLYVDALINHTFRDTPFGAPTIHVGLLTAVTNAETPAFTEALYGSYARQSIDGDAAWDAPVAGEGGRITANTGLIGFPQNTGSAETMIAAGIFSAITAGSLYFIIGIGGVAKLCTALNAGDLFTHDAHGFADDDIVRAENVPGVNALPTGLAENTRYFVANQTATTFTLSDTAGDGSPVVLTSDGQALIKPFDEIQVNANDTPEIAIGALVIPFD